MTKWIAEFDLEDGDTMPEYMELVYKGAKIHFYRKSLKQESELDKIRDESDKAYKKVAKELLDAFIEDQITIIGEFSGNMEQPYNWLNKKVINYAERLDENADEWIKRIKAAREDCLCHRLITMGIIDPDKELEEKDGS